MVEHWVIVGASSAIARACARELARSGVELTLIGRDRDDLLAIAADAKLRGAEATEVLECDIGSASDRERCVGSLVRQEARQLNLLLAVGQMPEQTAMERAPELAEKMLLANYVGAVMFVQRLLPRLEQQAGGRVVVLGSVAGDRGRGSNYLYGSTKAGLATWAEGLRARLFRSGVGVTVVKPGFVDTAMTWGLPGLFLVADPASVATRILRAARRGRSVVYAPGFWRWIMLIIRHIPPPIMKRLRF